MYFVFDYSEPNPILCKYSERREHCKNQKLIFDFVLPSRILYYANIMKAGGKTK